MISARGVKLKKEEGKNANAADADVIQTEPKTKIFNNQAIVKGHL